VIEHPHHAGRSTISSRIRGAIWGGGDVEVQRVRTLAEVRAARKALSHLELVLIDTPGLGAGDAAGAERLAKLLGAAGATEVHAVLPVAMEERERDAVLTRLVAAGASRVVITRLDEARRVGAVVDVTQRFDLELSYLGCGPCIPDDLRAADGAYIAARVLPMD
jgi:flagellar biosynthesis protein FlhF